MLSFDTQNGDMISVATHMRDGLEWVHWCSDWARIDELVLSGDLHRYARGEAFIGHVDYRVIPQLDRPRDWTV